jgi:hypothetical protein
MSTHRPYIDLRIDQLEKLVVDMPGANPINDVLLDELHHRNTQRALRLRGRLEKMRASAPKAPASEPHPQPQQATKPPPPLRPISTAANDPENILRAWTVLEVLSPASFRTPADLAGGDGRRVARFDRGLPWEGGPGRAPHGMRLYFQIVLGSPSFE